MRTRAGADGASEFNVQRSTVVMAARNGVEKLPGAEAAVCDQFLPSNAEILIDTVDCSTRANQRKRKVQWRQAMPHIAYIEGAVCK